MKKKGVRHKTRPGTQPKVLSARLKTEGKKQLEQVAQDITTGKTVVQQFSQDLYILDAELAYRQGDKGPLIQLVRRNVGEPLSLKFAELLIGTITGTIKRPEGAPKNTRFDDEKIAVLAHLLREKTPAKVAEIEVSQRLGVPKSRVNRAYRESGLNPRSKSKQ
jgi:predicted transcriptional regulator